MSAPIRLDDATEWLEADGLGGFASGTTGGLRTRRYHALLLAATTPPTGRMVLVNGLDAWITREHGDVHAVSPEYLTRQRYVRDRRLVSSRFPGEREPGPRNRYGAVNSISSPRLRGLEN